jgi:hypothetical protein
MNSLLKEKRYIVKALAKQRKRYEKVNWVYFSIFIVNLILMYMFIFLLGNLLFGLIHSAWALFFIFKIRKI